MNHNISSHAKKRFRQRGIDEKVISCVIRHGEAIYAPGGAKKYILKRKRKNLLIRDLKKYINLLERANGVIAVEKGGFILTGYHHF
jgi:hypothetical protein